MCVLCNTRSSLNYCINIVLQESSDDDIIASKQKMYVNVKMHKKIARDSYKIHFASTQTIKMDLNKKFSQKRNGFTGLFAFMYLLYMYVCICYLINWCTQTFMSIQFQTKPTKIYWNVKSI